MEVFLITSGPGRADDQPLAVFAIGVIVLVSLYLAALRHSSSWSAAAALSLTVGILASGLLWMIFRPGADRAYWIGFQLCGWAYLLVAFSDGSQAQLGSRLVTTRLASAVHAQMPITSGQAVMVEWHGTWYPSEVLRREGSRTFIHYTGYGANWDEWVGPERIRGPFGPFLRICHALMSVIVALVGGVLSGWLSVAAGDRRWFWIMWACGAATVIATAGMGLLLNSEWAAIAAISLLLVVLIMATLAGWRGEGHERSFALGFVIVGWGYFLLHFGPGLEASVGPHLLSTHLVNQLRDWMHPNPFVPMEGSGYTFTTTRSPSMARWFPGGNVNVACVIAAHALLALLLALAGGVVATSLSRRRSPV